MRINLNLAPQNKKEALHKTRILRMILKWELEISAVLIIFFLFIFSINYVSRMNLAFMDEIFKGNENNPQYIEMEKYNTGIEKINSQLADIRTIQNDQLYWSKLFSKLNDLVSEDIVLQNFSNKDLAVFLVGKARDRDGLVAFKERLESEVCFSEVKLPLSNLVSKEDVDFQIEFNIKEECLKEK